MKRILLALGAAACIAPRAGAQNIKFTEYDMPNGMHVILYEDHTTPIVATSIMYHVGSKNEDPQRTGFAHFFEHLLFEGSDNIGRGDYMKIVQSNGGQLNANTTQDRTYYYEVLPSNQLELALWMESERMLHARIDTTGIETQRKVVKEEKKQRYDNTPYGQLLNVMFENAYTTHPYRWSPIGKEQYIDQASFSEFMNFYKTYYVPNNAVMVVGGDLNTDQTKALITKYFGDIPKGTNAIPRDLPQEPEQKEEKRVTFYDNVQLPALVLGYHIPKQGTDDYYALQMLGQLLSQGESSRLRRNVVDRQQKAIQAGAFAYPSEDPGLMMMFAIAGMNVDIKDLEKAVLAEVDDVVKKQVSQDELQKLQNQMESDFYQGNQRVLGVVDNLATYYTFFGDANLINTELERYKKITAVDLQRVARKYLTKQNRIVVHYLSKKDQKG